MTVVWFNGPSQENLIHSLHPQECEIGCNYIQTRRPVHYVCAYDKQVVDSIQRDPSIGYYTRIEHAHLPHWKAVMDPLVSGINSGLLAVILATKLNKDPIYIIGCDWGLNEKSVFDYKRITLRKYTNAMKKILSKLTQRNPIFVVSDSTPDVPVPIVSNYNFLTNANK